MNDFEYFTEQFEVVPLVWRWSPSQRTLEVRTVTAGWQRSAARDPEHLNSGIPEDSPFRVIPCNEKGEIL